MTRLLPLVRFHLDGSPARATLDLDAADFTVGVGGEQVEARPVWKPGEARPFGFGDILHGGAALLLPSEGDANRNLLDARVVAFLVRGVVRGHDENMGEKAYIIGDDPIGYGLDASERTIFLQHERTLLLLDLFKPVPFILAPRPRSGELGTAAGQFGSPKIESDSDAAPSLREFGAERVPVFADPSLQHMLLGVAGRFGPHADGSARKRHRPRGNIGRATEQKHLLDGTFDGSASCAILAQSEQPALDNFASSDTQALACRRRIGFQRWKERIESTRPPGHEGEVAVDISPDFKIEQSGALLHETPHVTGQKLEIALAIEVAPQPVEARRDFAGTALPLPIHALVRLLDLPHPSAGESALESVNVALSFCASSKTATS